MPWGRDRSEQVTTQFPKFDDYVHGTYMRQEQHANYEHAVQGWLIANAKHISDHLNA